MAVVLRPVSEADLENIMRWRMDPEITKYMKLGIETRCPDFISQ